MDAHECELLSEVCDGHHVNRGLVVAVDEQILFIGGNSQADVRSVDAP